MTSVVSFETTMGRVEREIVAAFRVPPCVTLRPRCYCVVLLAPEGEAAVPERHAWGCPIRHLAPSDETRAAVWRRWGSS